MGFNSSPCDTWEILGILEDHIWRYVLHRQHIVFLGKNNDNNNKKRRNDNDNDILVSTIMIILFCDDNIDDDHTDNYDMTYTSIHDHAIKMW